VQVSKSLILFSLASEYDDSRTCQDGCVIITWLRRCTLDLRLYPTARIQIKYMSIVKVNVTLFLSTVVVTLQ